MTYLIQYPGRCGAIAAILVLMLAGCKKDGEQVRLGQGAFSSTALSASSGNIQLNASTLGDTAVTFKWPGVNYSVPVTISYTLQLDNVSDTSGASAWTSAKSFVVSDTSAAILGTDLNNYAAAKGFTPGTAAPVAVRVISNIIQQNGSATTVAPIYSNTIIVMLTPPPFPAKLYVPGGYQGWTPGDTNIPVLNGVTGKPGLYEGYVYITGSDLGFKYTDAPDWNHTNYGDATGGVMTTDGLANGMSVPVAGYYELTANLITNTWTANRTTWSILGDATPGNWTADTEMSYDPVTQTWSVTANMLHNGSFKFRANDAWNIDFGVDAGGNLAYADNAFFGYNSTINNITVPADGNYTLVLDLHVSGVYMYQLIKN